MATVDKSVGVYRKQSSVVIDGFSKSPKFVSSCYRCIHILNRFQYYTLISPYKVVSVENNKSIEIESSVWRKLAWGALQLMSIVIHCSSGRVSFTLTKTLREEPSQLYMIVGEVVWLLGFFYWSYQNLFQVASIQNLCQRSFKLRDEHALYKINLESMLVGAVCLVTFLQGVLFCYANTATYVQFNCEDIDLVGFNIQMPKNTFFRVCILILNNLVTMYKEMSEWSMFLQCFVACIVVFGISKDFEVFMLQSEYHGCEKMVRSYKTLKNLVNAVNETSSVFTLLVIINGMAEFCSYFTLIIGENTTLDEWGFQWTLRAVLLVYFVCYFTAIGLASEARSKFQKIHSSFLEKCCSDGQDGGQDGKLDAIILQNDVAQSPLGVRAHHFTLSYSVMVTILSTVFTYIFILVQLEADTPSHKNVSAHPIVH